VVVVSLKSGIENIPPGILLAAIFCELIGDLTMRYLILKGALYNPLIQSSANLQELST
jgi:hypothetical protein